MTVSSHRRRPAFGAIALLVLMTIACACPGFGGSNQPTTPAAPSTGGSVPQGNNTSVRLGRLVTTSQVEAGSNRPVNTTTDFQNPQIIYVVAEIQEIPAGTSVFARWSRDGTPFEDTSTITADRTYTNTFLEFHIQPKTDQALPAGNYAVTLYVNGNPHETVNFRVR